MKNHPYLSKEDIKYFSSYWNEYQKNNQNELFYSLYLLLKFLKFFFVKYFQNLF